ncbi:MAG: tetratricopeptide repeat protein [Planctomycetota bacterium]
MARGAAFAKQKRYDAAIAEYDAALKLMADHAPAYFARGAARQFKAEISSGLRKTTAGRRSTTRSSARRT